MNEPTEPEHRHHFHLTGYGESGSTFYRCDCGETDVWP